MRRVTILGWAVSLAALTTMVVGHLGDHELDWRLNQISTYAARAPYDYLVTSSMLLSAGAVIILGFVASMQEVAGSGLWTHLMPPLAGAAAAGLMVLARYEETAATLSILKQSGFWAVRQQSFHDAGLVIFLYSTILLVTLLGSVIVICNSTVFERILGAIILASGPAAFWLMSIPWTKSIGIVGAYPGLQQRASLLSLWLAMILFLGMASKKSSQAGKTRSG